MAKKTIRLIASNDKKPAVKLKVGEKLEVVAVQMVAAGAKAKAGAARLCGGTSTCVALVRTGRDEK